MEAGTGIEPVYADMVSDPKSWIRAVASVFGYEGSEQVERIGRSLAPHLTADREDRWDTKRQVTPGDYERKLRPDTIDRLNDVFGDVLMRLGYPA